MNAKEKVLRLCNKEDIEAINIEGKLYKKNKIEEALKKIDYEFNDGYGLPEGPEIFVWCKNWIIISVCYDGSEWYDLVPRNPTEEEIGRYEGGC